MSELILSLFPGAGLLDKGFEQAGFCVVRGPDTLLGGDIREFFPPAGHFTGVIGGPPCQDFSRARRRPPTGHGVEMLKQFARCVTAASPEWFLCENVPGVPSLVIPGWQIQRFNMDARDCGVNQTRLRTFQFGYKNGAPLTPERRTVSQSGAVAKTVMANDGRKDFRRLCELQGLSSSFTLPGLSFSAKKRAVGNGVPVPMAFAIAYAISHRDVMGYVRRCHCGCGRRLTGKQNQIAATPACRKRLERARRGDTPGIVTL